jgi:hypothetical protein
MCGGSPYEDDSWKLRRSVGRTLGDGGYDCQGGVCWWHGGGLGIRGHVLSSGTLERRKNPMHWTVGVSPLGGERLAVGPKFEKNEVLRGDRGGGMLSPRTYLCSSSLRSHSAPFGWSSSVPRSLWLLKLLSRGQSFLPERRTPRQTLPSWRYPVGSRGRALVFELKFVSWG